MLAIGKYSNYFRWLNVAADTVTMKNDAKSTCIVKYTKKSWHYFGNYSSDVQSDICRSFSFGPFVCLLSHDDTVWTPTMEMRGHRATGTILPYLLRNLNLKRLLEHYALLQFINLFLHF